MRDDPFFSRAPAIERARRHGSAQAIDGVSAIAGSGQPPIRPVAAATAAICVGVTSIWSFVFFDPYMPNIDPLIDYAWFVPTGPLFGTMWLILTIMIAIAFYLVLRAARSPARSAAISALLLQFALKPIWAWMLFVQRTPVTGLYLMALFVACVVASLWYSAKVDRRATLLMAPHLAWVAFILATTARIAVIG